jgi:hypothetical protein
MIYGGINIGHMIKKIVHSYAAIKTLPFANLYPWRRWYTKKHCSVDDEMVMTI